jgi:5'-3' exonuclease
MKMTAKRTW